MFVARYVKNVTFQRLDSSLSSSGEKSWGCCYVFAPLERAGRCLLLVEMWDQLEGTSPYY